MENINAGSQETEKNVGSAELEGLMESMNLDFAKPETFPGQLPSVTHLPSFTFVLGQIHKNSTV